MNNDNFFLILVTIGLFAFSFTCYCISQSEYPDLGWGIVFGGISTTIWICIAGGIKLDREEEKGMPIIGVMVCFFIHFTVGFFF